MKIVAGMIRLLEERRRNRKRKERFLHFFLFLLLFFFSRPQKHDARRLSDFFNKHNSLSPFPRERALDNIIDNNNNSNGRSVL
jgi:hypothetical protein